MKILKFAFLASAIVIAGVALLGPSPASASVVTWADLAAEIQSYLPPGPARQELHDAAMALEVLEASGSPLDIEAGQKEFAQVLCDHSEAHPFTQLDLDTMTGWFNGASANSIVPGVLAAGKIKYCKLALCKGAPATTCSSWTSGGRLFCVSTGP